MFMGNFCNRTNIGNCQGWISWRFNVNQFRIWTNCLANRIQIRSIHNGGFHLKFVVEQFVQQPINGDISDTGKNNMVTALQQSKK